MKFIKLLMAGSSLFGFKQKPIKYEMVSGNPLPKFGSVEKPVSSATVDESGAQVTGTLFRQKQSRKPTSQSAEVTARNQKSLNKVGGPPPVSAQSVRSEDFSCETSAASKSRFQFSKLFAAENVSKASRRLVQGELVLDSVQVVRNDLNDTDMELIAVEKQKISAVREEELRRASNAAEFGKARNDEAKREMESVQQ